MHRKVPDTSKASERRFPKDITMIDHRPVSVRRLTCATEGCGFQGELIDQSRSGLVSLMVERKFEAKGWTVGSRESEDRCPACTDRERAERRAKRNPHRGPRAVNLKLVEDTIPEGESNLPQTVATAELPTTMSRDEKRLIFAKLHDVYIDDKQGYQTPWTDATVAKDLGVPMAWVAGVREENFGPAHDNQEIRDMLDRVELGAKEAQSVLIEAKAIRAEGAALVEHINALNRRAVDIGHNLAGLLALADRIRKAVE